MLEPVRPAGSVEVVTGDAGTDDIWPPLQGTVAFPLSIPVHNKGSVSTVDPNTDPEGWSKSDRLIC